MSWNMRAARSPESYHKLIACCLQRFNEGHTPFPMDREKRVDVIRHVSNFLGEHSHL